MICQCSMTSFPGTQEGFVAQRQYGGYSFVEHCFFWSRHLLPLSDTSWKSERTVGATFSCSLFMYAVVTPLIDCIPCNPSWSRWLVSTYFDGLCWFDHQGCNAAEFDSRQCICSFFSYTPFDTTESTIQYRRPWMGWCIDEFCIFNLIVWEPLIPG